MLLGTIEPDGTAHVDVPPADSARFTGPAAGELLKPYHPGDVPIEMLNCGIDYCIIDRFDRL